MSPKQPKKTETKQVRWVCPPWMDIGGLNPEDRDRIYIVGFDQWLDEASKAQEERLSAKKNKKEPTNADSGTTKKVIHKGK